MISHELGKHDVAFKVNVIILNWPTPEISKEIYDSATNKVCMRVYNILNYHAAIVVKTIDGLNI